MIFNKNNFNDEVLGSEIPVLVDFYADWCGPCIMMAPLVEEIATELEGKVKVGKINVDENGEIAAQYGVMTIPTFAIFSNGKLIKTTLGVMGKEDLIDFAK